jgi:outer membrane receptor protein involved in Fe transport
VDNSYKQQEVGFRTFLVIDSKLQLSGQIGQTTRTHKEISQRDFSGLTGRLDANWQATGKLQVAGSMYRQLGAVDDIYASYALTDGIRLTPSLQITPKLKLSAEAYYENLNFKGDPFSVTSFFGPRRKDIGSGGSLSLTYQPDTWASLTLSYQTGNRETNNHAIANDFSYRMLSLFVQLQF